MECLEIGFKNLEQHSQNLRKFGLPVVVAINKFTTDTDKEIELLENLCNKIGYKRALVEGFTKGGAGSIDLANKILETLETKKSDFKCLYNLNDSLENKITKIAKEIYRAEGVEFSDLALEKLENIRKLGKDNLPVCIAKTPSSFSDNTTLLNAPRGFNIHVKDLKVSNGAGFVVVYTGNILTMPGLPKVPQAVKMQDY